jgi:hypothetical protein
MDEQEEITIHEIAHHRNGVAGEPFAVVTFTSRLDGPARELVAVLFSNDDKTLYANPRTAVFELDRLARGVIAFGQNSYRGDVFDGYLRAEVVKQGYLEQ